MWACPGALLVGADQVTDFGLIEFNKTLIDGANGKLLKGGRTTGRPEPKIKAPLQTAISRSKS